MKTLYWQRSGLWAVVLVAVIGGCDRGGEEAAKGGEGQVEKGGVAVVAELADISLPVGILATNILDGNLAADVLGMELLRGDWEDGRLVHLTAEQSPMALARRYEYLGADSSDIRFHMRSDARWSDGRPITAHDVAFTYRLLPNPELASPRREYAEQIDSVVAQSDSTVTFHFKRRYPQMISHASLPPMPRHIYEGVAPGQLRNHPTLLDPSQGRLVVSGPFMIGEWRKGDRVVLVPNPHFRPQPNLSQIVFRVIPEPMTRLVELQTGNVDLVQNVSFDQLPTLRSQANVRLEREEKRYYDYIAYNPKAHPAFADAEVRRALGMAIDVPRLIQVLQMDEFAVPAGGPYPPIFRELYDEKLTPPLAHDLERARQILDARGWRDTNGDGIRDKDGRALRFKLVTNAGSQRRADATQVIQQQWRQLGVDAQLQALEFNTMMQNLMKQEYEAVLSGWGVALNPDISNLFGEGSPLNLTGYRNPQVTQLFERALAQPTPEAAAPVWKQAASMLARDQPYTWLYYFDAVDAVRDRLRNIEIDTYGYLNNTWEWWIPRSQQGASAAATPKDTAR